MARSEDRMETDFDNCPTHVIDKSTPPTLIDRGVHQSTHGVPPHPTLPSESDEPARPNELVEADLFDQHGRNEFQAGRYREARVLHERAMELRRRLLGEDDPRLPNSFCGLGALAFHQGRLDEAEWHFRQAREVADKRGLGRDPLMGLIFNNLGVIARCRGDLGEARARYELALGIKVEVLGWQHTSVAASLINLGRLAELAGDLGDALGHFARARAICEVVEGALGPGLAAALLGLGRVQFRRGSATLAAFAFDRALRIREAIPCSPAQLASVRFFTAIAIAYSDPIEARALMIRAIRDYRAAERPLMENLTAMTAWLALLDARSLRSAN